MDILTQLRYQGYRATPPLWESLEVSPFRQIQLPVHPEKLDAAAQFRNQRLGKLVEEFVFFQLKKTPSVNWVFDSLQIQENKRTVGELDALYYDQDVAIHLEIAYKFYLYDTLEKHRNPLAHWIGPNRKDNLSLKLDKLRSKQFPLLHHPLTSPYLERLDLKASNLEQRLCFKAQLFVPYGWQAFDPLPLNPACIVGFYLSFDAITQLQDYQFFIPEKLDWLITPHHDVAWMDFSVASDHLKAAIDAGRSPMVWLRHPDGMLAKGFVVFW